MRKSIQTSTAVAIIAIFASAMPAQADCKKDVADAFAKQRDGSAYRMKTRQISPRGVIFMTVDYQLPFKMHQRVKSATRSEKTELILIGKRAWTTAGLGWTQMSNDETTALNKQFGANVISPPEDPLKYECLGQIDVDGRTLLGYQGKEGSSGNVRTSSVVIRTIYVDPETGLPVQSSVARETKPDLAFFKADYTYPKDIEIEPPKESKPARADKNATDSEPNQSKKPQ